MNLTDWIGTVGVGLLLVAYFLNATNRLAQNSKAYIILNLLGALLAGLASVLLNYVPFIILEGAWVIVSVSSLISASRRT